MVFPQVGSPVLPVWPSSTPTPLKMDPTRLRRICSTISEACRVFTWWSWCLVGVYRLSLFFFKHDIMTLETYSMYVWMYACMHACMHACVYIPWYNHINIYICVNIYVYIQYTCIHPAESSWPSPSPSSTCLFFQGHPPLGWYLDCMDGWCPERSNPRAGVHQWEAGDAAVVTNLFRLIGSTVFC